MVWLAVAGAVLAVLGFVLAWSSRTDPIEFRTKIVGLKGPATGLVIVLLGAGFLLIGLADPWNWSPDRPIETSTGPAESAGRIDSPANGSRVEPLATVIGSFKGLPTGHRVFLLVLDQNVNHLVPVSIDVQSSGRWSSPVTVGGEESFCTPFELQLVVAGPAGSELFNKYIADPKAGGMDAAQVSAGHEVAVLHSVGVMRARMLVANPFGSTPGQVEKCDGLTGNRDLGAYCRSLGFPEGVELTKGQAGSAHNNWACRSATSSLNFLEACAFAYPGRRVVGAAPNNLNDPYTWRCYVSPALE